MVRMMTSNLGVVSDIKQRLIQDILTDEKSVKLLKNQSSVTIPALDLRYTQVFPWTKVPDTVEEALTFVTFEVRIPEVITEATRNYQLIVYVMAHEDMMKIAEAEGTKLGIDDRGTRIDILADRIDYLINGSEKYTFDQMKFLSSEVFTPADNYFGRLLRYEIRGWNRSGEKLG